jgi:hypothetical protein
MPERLTGSVSYETINEGLSQNDSPLSSSITRNRRFGKFSEAEAPSEGRDQRDEAMPRL